MYSTKCKVNTAKVTILPFTNNTFFYLVAFFPNTHNPKWNKPAKSRFPQ